jgi:2-succinyl-5-enolpyruvyl-6-hydroxy-3-cyclohexene-1-carboxylate synthase
VNIGLAEPLYEKLPEPLPDLIKPLKPSDGDGDKPDSMPELAFKKVLLLAGMGSYEKEITPLLNRLITSLEGVVIAENIANLRSDLFIANPELLFAGASESELLELAPEVVISFGGQVVSKRLKLFLESLNHAVFLEIEENPIYALEELGRGIGPGNSSGYNPYLERWKKIEQRETERAAKYLADAPFSIFTVIQRVLAETPGGAVVHLGNSSTIRYSQLLPVRNDLVYHSNRGTSGIDGSLSAAVGAALVSENLHLLLLGDLSFVYDSNALWNRHFPDNLKIVVLNDGGGGIFRLLKGPDQMDFFEEFSVTHHPVSLELLSQAFGRGFQRINSLEELNKKMAHMFQPGSAVGILEVDATESENSRIFKEFFNLNH